MAAPRDNTEPRRRLIVEILARTGIRSGELSGLGDDAMVLIGDIHWLRIPVGKLRNDRYVPLLPMLVELIDHHHATRPPPRSGRLVERRRRPPLRPAHHPSETAVVAHEPSALSTLRRDRHWATETGAQIAAMRLN